MLNLLRSMLTVFCLLIACNASAANPRVELATSMGSITLELYPDKAPATVANFLRYVKDGFYDGTLFHRVIPDFMIQGGGYSPGFVEKQTRGPVKNEAGNGLQNTVGMVAMARTSDPHSATAQFFINLADNDFLNFTAPTAQGYGYTVFGKVVKGIDVVEKIGRVKTGPGPAKHTDVPLKPVIIKHARIEKTSIKSNK